MLMGVFFYLGTLSLRSIPGQLYQKSAWPILSSSISCPHKCQAPSVCYSSTLTMSFFYTSLSLSTLSKCHFIMHSSSLGLFSPTFPPRCPPLCSDAARLFFSFHLDSIIPLLFQVILRESFLLSSPLRNHTIGLATSVSF